MLSIIICTYNREKYIYNLLKSLAENTLSKEEYEIILVDNNCADNTHAEVNRFCDDFKDVELHYFVETNQGLSYARNRGIQESKGDILVYVDDDALVNNQYLSTYSDFFKRNPKIEAAGGAILPQYETEEPEWMSHYTRALITGKLDFGNKEREFPSNSFPGGGNAAYRKELFDRIGLFNVELGRKGNSLIGAEEKDLFDKMTSIGVRFFYLPNAILYHQIQAHKVTREYLEKLSHGIGVSERIRTKSISTGKFIKRIVQEGIKWAGTTVIAAKQLICMEPSKAKMLVLFRWNVTKGLLGF
ncbi:MAG: glycosyltransferase [Paludibacteraceae bacterium]|nr:glycosyltransferase family 2 protein [Candidatus Physcocola equi]MCQ2234005.1 glycosyltransferase [Paludibacteraceae bacterium]